MTSKTDLQGLREALLGPHPNNRDTKGWLTHPAMPYLDESTDVVGLLHAVGLDVAVIALEDADEEMTEQYASTGTCAHWTPPEPAGDGWRLIEVYDTEDGPLALFVQPETTQRMARTHTRHALAIVLAERQRQISECGYRPLDDDFYVQGQLPRAAAAYAVSAAGMQDDPLMLWPWLDDGFKPRGAIEDLARAGALIVAEIERHLRVQTRRARQEAGRE